MGKNIKIILAVGMIVFILLVTGGGAVYASNASVPGDLLFPIDIAAENVRRRFIKGTARSVEYEVDIMYERVSELEEVEEEGDSDSIGKSIEEVDKQQERVQEEVQHMEQECSEGKIDEAVLNRVMERVRLQTEEHVSKMEEVSNKQMEKGNDQAAQAIEEAIQKQEEMRQQWEEKFQDKGSSQGQGRGVQ